jgi:hypothetical protein
MADTYDYMKVSDGTGDAALMHITTPRIIGATVIQVDTVVGVPAFFIATYGTLLSSGFIDPTTKRDFYGHTSAGTLVIDGFCAGSTDSANTTGQVVVIKPNTQWANDVIALAQVSHNNDGTLKTAALSTIFPPSEVSFDFIVPGGAVLSGTGYGTTLNWSLSAGVVYIGGKRLTVAAATGTVIASKDTYFDLLDPGGTNTVATLVNTGGNIVANNAASPALAASSVRLGIIVSGVTIAAATSVNQGQMSATVPVVSGNFLSVTDTSGNLICPRDPLRRILGYRQATSSQSTSSGSYVDLTGLSCPVIVPAGRNVKVYGFMGLVGVSSAGAGSKMALVDATASNTFAEYIAPVANAGYQLSSSPVGFPVIPAAGARTYKAQLGLYGAAATIATNAATAEPIFIAVELA